MSQPTAAPADVEPLEPLPTPYKCDGDHAAPRRVRYLGPIQIEICEDPKCARIFATCEHPKCTWNAEGTVLTCDFCGVDGT